MNKENILPRPNYLVKHSNFHKEKFIPSAQPTEIITGYRKQYYEFLLRFRIIKIVLRNYSSLFTGLKVLKSLDQNRRHYLGKSNIKKISKVEGKIYWDLYVPGFPSLAFDEFIKGESHRIVPLKSTSNRFTNIILALTKKCNLQCEHCFEWDQLNKKEVLSQSNIENIVHKFQSFGTAQFQLSGGEPMLRLNSILTLLNTVKHTSEFWVLSSGYDLTIENARTLKKAGLIGVVISLDHFDPELHNNFRKNTKSFHWAKEAVSNCIASGLVASLSLCATRAFVTESNMMSYAHLAKNMGVSFVQILEPKAVGHYKGMDVHLSDEQLKILANFSWRMNFTNEFKDYPIINYHGAYQRNTGCFAAGNRTLYIDTDGNLNACPFCNTKVGSALAEEADEYINKMFSAGCDNFNAVKI
ncbi:MAG: radical SAM protein [bacterium]|nr:radical SAM protein [bacterium]